MTKYSFYKTNKVYQPKTKSWLTDDIDTPELTRFHDVYYGTVILAPCPENVVNPVFYLCRDKGVLRLNRYTFLNVDVPEELIAGVRSCSDVEIIFSLNNSSHSFYAKVKRLLRLPDYLNADLQDNADNDEAEETGSAEKTDEEEKRWERTPPLGAFEAWLREKGGEIIFSSPESSCLLAHDKHNLLLVSFFDETDSFWLADEESIMGEPPKWISEQGTIIDSPLHKLKLAADHLNSLDFCNVFPLLIMSDHIGVVNDDEIVHVWEEMGLNVCYCFRSESYLESFENVLERAATVNGKCRVPSTENMKKLKMEFIKYEETHR